MLIPIHCRYIHVENDKYQVCAGTILFVDYQDGRGVITEVGGGVYCSQ